MHVYIAMNMCTGNFLFLISAFKDVNRRCFSYHNLMKVICNYQNKIKQGILNYSTSSSNIISRP